MQLVIKFRQFVGLGLSTNPFFWIYVALVGTVSGVAYLLILKFDWAMALPKLLGVTPAPWFAPVIGLLVPGMAQRLIGAQGGSGASSQVLDLARIKIRDVLFDAIRDSIGVSLHREVTRMARRYDLRRIQDTACHLVLNEETLGGLNGDGEALRARIREFAASGDPRTDFNNKYLTLHRAIEVVSFKRLKASLAGDGAARDLMWPPIAGAPAVQPEVHAVARTGAADAPQSEVAAPKAEPEEGWDGVERRSGTERRHWNSVKNFRGEERRSGVDRRAWNGR